MRAASHAQQVHLVPASDGLLKQMAVVLTVAGYDQRRIAEQLGVSQPTISRWLRDPQADQYQRVLTQQLVDGAVLLLRRYAIEAVETLVEVMRTANSHKTRLDAAKAILDRIGLNTAIDLIEQQDAAETNAERAEEDQPLLARFRASPIDIQHEVASLYDQIDKLLSQPTPH
jgi:predicted transcriptional regulator